MRLVNLYKTILCAVSFFLFSCTESFVLKTESFEDVLVVEATITNELKNQEIKLSRTFLLESDVQPFEVSANVRIEASNNVIYSFSETESGVYVSNEPFQATEGLSYKLLITTTDGKQYNSNEEYLAPKAEIDNLYAELIIKEGQEGIQVLLDSNENLGEAKFFRFEYEETYEILVQAYQPFDLVFSNVTTQPTGFDYNIVERSEGRICYDTKYSTDIILTTVNSLSENKLSQFPVRFIPSHDPTIRNRYSILVKQYVQSFEANNFYKILKSLGADNGLLVDNQPGFVKGNVFSQQNSNEKVIGFFDVSSVTTKRIYFSYRDFNTTTVPQYFFNDCDFKGAGHNSAELYFYANPNGYYGYKYFSEELNLEGEIIGFYLVSPECGDCTTFASPIKPEFWED